MVTEFGEPGVENPMVMDLITLDAESGKVVLAMFERRSWGADPRQLGQIEEKINRYMGYVLDGFLAEQYPQYTGKQVRVRLDCAEAPDGEAADFVEAARQAMESHGLEFVVNVTAGFPPADMDTARRHPAGGGLSIGATLEQFVGSEVGLVAHREATHHPVAEVDV